VREVARDADWQTTIRFFREISNQAKSEADFVLVADLARQLGRRDLAVIAGQAAENAGYDNFHDLAYPLIPVPPGADWTFTHAITRRKASSATTRSAAPARAG
jgi:soluble lytic murein transglycosylase